jgi:hypothetical protein
VTVDHRQDALELDENFDELVRVLSLHQKQTRRESGCIVWIRSMLKDNGTDDDLLLDDDRRGRTECEGKDLDRFLDLDQVRLDFLHLALIARDNHGFLHFGDRGLALTQRVRWFDDRRRLGGRTNHNGLKIEESEKKKQRE